MPPATSPIPVLLLDNMKTALLAIDGGANYYHSTVFAGFGKDPEDPMTGVSGYPAVMLGEPREVGFIKTPDDDRDQSALHGTWHWEIPVFGVINDVGLGDDAYRSLHKLAADIFRAMTADYTRGGLAYDTLCRGWSILGPQISTQGRPWVAVIFRVKFRTRENEMVTVPA